MYNKIIIQGNLTRDIELKNINGTVLANCGIASTRKFKTSLGQSKEETLFVDIVFFGRTAEIANQYLYKGSKVLIDGRLRLEQWNDARDGSKRSKHTVVVETMQMLGSKNDNQQQNNNSNQNNYQNSNSQQQNGYVVEETTYTEPQNSNPAPNQQNAKDIDEDEIPF